MRKNNGTRHRDDHYTNRLDAQISAGHPSRTMPQRRELIMLTILDRQDLTIRCNNLLLTFRRLCLADLATERSLSELGAHQPHHDRAWAKEQHIVVKTGTVTF